MSIKDSLGKAAAIFGAPSEPRCVLMSEDVKEKMINEPFDITKHEFSDTALESCEYEEGGGEEKLLCFAVDEFNDCGASFKLNKDDSIAIVKALGVTGEDLK